MLDLLEFIYGRYNGGSIAPVGSYLNPRTLCIFQTASDATLPQDGTFCRVTHWERRRLRTSRQR